MDLSLLNQTDRFVTQPATIYEDRGAYGVLRTPSGPSYYSGNKLLLAAPPTLADLPRWEAVWAATFPDPAVRHRRFEWGGGPEPDAAARAAYAAAGYKITTIVCLTYQGPPPALPAHPALDMRPLTPADQGALRRFYLESNGDWGAAFNDFMVANIYERLAVLEGGWWLGWLDGRIAGSMGLFFHGPLGRFQSVDTHPAFRRQGVARTMVAALTRAGLARPGTETLVIAADRDYFARQLYEACGYRPAHLQYELFRPPPPAPPAAEEPA